MPTRRMGMTHLNGNILCAVAIETSGDTPGHHDLLQICVTPLDYRLEPWATFLPFYSEIQPKNPDNYDPGARSAYRNLLAHAQINGLSWDKAADLFEAWYENLGLARNKRIVPLAHDWPLGKEFIVDWLGREAYKSYFDTMYRDVMAFADYENDKKDLHTETPLFPFCAITHLSRALKIEYKNHHDALNNCNAIIKIYKSMVTRNIF